MKMESLNFHKVKAGKANKIQKHRHLRMIANLLRYLDVCVVLVLISRLSIQQLPVALKHSSEYFHGFMVSPRFVFLVGNVIIITLFAQSGHFSAPNSSKTGSEPDLYLEFLQNSTMNHNIQAYQENLSMKAEKSIKGHRNDGCIIKYPEKQSTKTEERIKLVEKQGTKTKTSLEVKDYRRCQSDIVRGSVESEKPQCVLQRCETDKSRRSIEGIASETERVGRTSYPEDGMSNDEFRRKIEAFIARQQRLRTQELQAFSS